MHSIRPAPPPRPFRLPPPKPVQSKVRAQPVDIASARAKPAEHPGTDDAVLHLMREYGAPIDRESYLHFAYGANVPEMTPELESMLPAELQDMAQFEKGRK